MHAYNNSAVLETGISLLTKPTRADLRGCQRLRPPHPQVAAVAAACWTASYQREHICAALELLDAIWRSYEYYDDTVVLY